MTHDLHWTIAHVPEGNVIHVESSGTMTVKPLNQMVAEVVEAGRRHDSRRFLMDHRKAVIELSFFAVFERPSELQRLGMRKNARIAQVYSAENVELFRFLETVAVNRGYQLRVFTDLALAKEWLSG